MAVEDLDEQGIYDLVQIPLMFMSAEVLAKGFRAVKEALRPGGWVTLHVLAAPGDQLAPAVLRLLTILWGGDPIVPEQVVEMLGEAGFADSAILPAVPGPPVRFVVGRRPTASSEPHSRASELTA